MLRESLFRARAAFRCSEGASAGDRDPRSGPTCLDGVRLRSGFGVACRSQAAFSLWFLGYPDEARRLNEEAVALAERLNHPYSLAAALDFSAWVDQLRGDIVAAKKHAENAIAISMKHDFVFWLLTAMILRGWALTASDRIEEGITQMLRLSPATNKRAPEYCGHTIWRYLRMCIVDGKGRLSASKIGRGGSRSAGK